MYSLSDIFHDTHPPVNCSWLQFNLILKDVNHNVPYFTSKLAAYKGFWLYSHWNLKPSQHIIADLSIRKEEIFLAILQSEDSKATYFLRLLCSKNLFYVQSRNEALSSDIINGKTHEQVIWKVVLFFNYVVALFYRKINHQPLFFEI